MARVEAGAITPQDVAAHMTGLAEMVGTPPDLLMNLSTHFDRELPAEFVETQEQSAEGEQDKAAADGTQQQPAQANASVTASTIATTARPAAPAPDRAALQQEIAKHEANMRAPEGSPEWNAYWKQGGSTDYLRALQAREAADAAPARMTIEWVEQPDAAPAQAQPAPAAETAATGA
jgi:hypothetical protein